MTIQNQPKDFVLNNRKAIEIHVRDPQRLGQETAIVFLDRQVENYQHLAAGIIPGTKVIILDPMRDGVEQISATLSTHSQLSSVHIIAHGAPGSLQLGSSQLNLDTFSTYSSQLQSWFSSPSYSTPPSLLIYGCNVAAGDAGAEFIAQLKQLTGSEIAASTSPIGNAALGGNWQLDVSTTNIPIPLALQPETMASYSGVLVIGIDDLEAQFQNLEPDPSENFSSPGAGNQAGTTFDVTFRVGEENNFVISGFTAGGQRYEIVEPLDGININRVNNATVTGTRELLWFEQESIDGTSINLKPAADSTMEEALLNDVINRGTDNVFANQGNIIGNDNNIERIDFTSSTGLSVAESLLAQTGFLILERGGNDGFQIAAITEVDDQGNPTAFGSLVEISADTWGLTNSGLSSAIFRQDEGDANLGYTITRDQQSIGGVFVSYEDLGISADQTFFGYALLPPDVSESNDLLGLSDVPTGTSENDGGLDLIAGGLAFTLVPENIPVVNISGATVAEDVGVAEFVVTLDQASTGLVAVDFTTADDSAIAPDDYTTSSGTLNFAPGETTATISVPLVDDDANEGEESFSIVLSTPVNANLGNDTATVTIADNDDVTNNSPIATDNEGTTPPGVPIYFNALVDDSDPDGDPLVFDSITQPANGSLVVDDNGTPDNPTDDVLIYTPNPGFTGTDEFTYTISDGNGGTDTGAIAVEVTPSSSAADDGASTTPNQPVNVNVLGNDTGSPTLTEVGTPTSGTATINDNGTPTDPSDDFVVYTPNPEFVGVDTFTYTVTNSDGTPATATVTVNVDPAQPLAVDDEATTTPGVPTTINVLANDSDPNGQPLTITNLNPPARGQVVLNDDGTITYTPNPGFTATDTFTYTVSDPDGNASTGTVSVNVAQAEPEPQDITLVEAATDNGLFVTNGPAEENIKLKFTLDKAGGVFINEVGVFKLDDESGTVDGLTAADPNYFSTVINSADVIFSRLSETPVLFEENPTRIIDGFSNDDVLGFYLVVNDTTDEVLRDLSTGSPTSTVFFSLNGLSSDGMEHAQITDLGDNTFMVDWEDILGGGDFDFNDLGFIVAPTLEDAPLGNNLQGQSQQELIDLTAQTGQQVQLNFESFSEAFFTESVGFYPVADAAGTVIDPSTGNSVSPGDANYTQVALAATVAQFDPKSNGSAVLNGGSIYASYLNVEGQGVFFPFIDANPDGVDHLRLLGDNTFGYEDTLASQNPDFDFNDAVFSVELTTV